MAKTAENMFKIQMQARENATELNDYLRGLDSWQEDIKKKDKTFKEMKPKNEGMVPPVRSGMQPKEKKRDVKQKPAKRLKSYDYKSWDKLDVDKMLEEIEDNDEQETQIRTEEKAIKLEDDLKKLSVEEKEKGNEHFKNGRYSQALECYSKGMQYDPSNPILPANRAMTYLKLGKMVETEADCTLTLSLDPVYVKAYLRRGTARVAMGKVESAVRDFNDVLKLEPDNKQASQELDKISRSESASDSGVGGRNSRKNSHRIRAVIKAENRKSKKPLRRVPVQEIGPEVTRPAAKSDGDVTTRLLDAIRDAAEPCLDPPPPRPASPRRARPLIEEIASSPLEVVPEPIASPRRDDDVTDDDDDVIVASDVLTRPPPPPATCFQFQADVRRLKQCGGLMTFEYLRSVAPSCLGRLLKDQLDADTLTLVVACFKSHADGNEEFVLDFLHNLSSVKRFNMAVLFLSNAVKQDVRDICDRLQFCLPSQRETISAVRRLFGVL